LIDGYQHANFFMHNGPALYISAGFGAFFGPYNGWLTLNILCHLITATAIYLAVRHYTSRTCAAFFCFLYFVSPIAIWQTLNVMQEQFFGALVSLLLLGFIYRHRTGVRQLTFTLLALVVGVHPLFTALTALCLIVLLWHSLKKQSSSLLLKTLLFGTVAVASYYAYTQLFPSTFQPDLHSIVAGSAPGGSSMLWHYSDSLPAITFDLLLSKLQVFVNSHVTTPVDFLFTNAAFVCGGYLLLQVLPRKQELRSVVALSLFVLSLYVAMSTLLQTQPRYQQIFATPTFLLIALALYELRRPLGPMVKAAGFYAVAPTMLCAGVYLCLLAGSQAKAQEQGIEALRALGKTLPMESRLVLINTEHETKLSFALRPRQLLSIKTQFLAPAAYNNITATFQPDHMISTQPAPDFPLPYISVGHWEVPQLGAFHLFKVFNSEDDMFVAKRRARSDAMMPDSDPLANNN